MKKNRLRLLGVSFIITILLIVVVLLVAPGSTVVDFGVVDVNAAAKDTEQTNLLVNGSFEGGFSHPASRTVRYDPSGVHYNPYGEIQVPDGYSIYWFEGFPCASHPPKDQGRPEVKVIDLDAGFPDPLRVYTGTKALQAFTFWNCHRMGFFQPVTVTEGIHYSLKGYAHAWYSSCPTEPHGPPLDNDCVTPWYGAWDHLKIGIDPTGGTDPRSSTVIWSDPYEIYGVYGDALELNHIEALSTTITIFAESECNYPLHHDDVYWDWFSLTQDLWTAFLSFITKGWEWP